MFAPPCRLCRLSITSHINVYQAPKTYPLRHRTYHTETAHTETIELCPPSPSSLTLLSLAVSLAVAFIAIGLCAQYQTVVLATCHEQYKPAFDRDCRRKMNLLKHRSDDSPRVISPCRFRRWHPPLVSACKDCVLPLRTCWCRNTSHSRQCPSPLMPLLCHLVSSILILAFTCSLGFTWSH